MNDWTFEATQFNPEQGVGKHPVGKKFQAMVKMTSREAVKDKPQNGYFSVLFETPAGQIVKNYNLQNDNQQAVEIAQKQLSALCHATGVHRLTGQGEPLRGALLMIDVDYQKGQEPTAEKPGGGYVEVSKVYDKSGNEPGKAPASLQPQTNVSTAWGGAQPQGQLSQPSGGWGGQAQPSTGAQQGWTQNTTEPNKKPPWG